MSEARHERTFRLEVLALAGVALALRLVQAHALSTDLFAGVLVQDARVYRETALRLPGGVSFMNVGYPWFLAAIARVLSPSISAVLLAVAIAVLIGPMFVKRWLVPDARPAAGV